MFAKLTRFRGLGRRQGPPALAKRAPCNDNRPFRRVVALSRRVQRPVLACRWRQVLATGRLECIWQVVPVDAAAAEEIGISCMIRRDVPPAWYLMSVQGQTLRSQSSPPAQFVRC
jgi:hypothetical protein